MMNRRQRKPLKSQEPSNATPPSPERFRPNPEGESAQQSRMQHSEPSINNRRMDLDDDETSGSPKASPQNENSIQLPNHPNFFTVYMSAVEHPGHFWLQIITPKARQFDLLMETMTEFYRQKQNQEEYKPDCLSTGDIVAAPFDGDSLWYRARVLNFLEDNKVDLYYVDYGDNGQVDRDTVYNLRADHLSLPYQAVEAFLHGAYPTDGEWSEPACDWFEDKTYCAQWRPLMARIVSYNDVSQPSVELIDTNGAKDKNILEELIERGFAKAPTSANRTASTLAHTQPNPPSSPLRTMESANLQNRTSPLHQNGDKNGRNNSYQGGTG